MCRFSPPSTVEGFIVSVIVRTEASNECSVPEEQCPARKIEKEFLKQGGISYIVTGGNFSCGACIVKAERIG